MNPFINAHQITDEQLMEKYQKGDSMAFEALYFRHKKTVYSFLHKRLKPEESVNEVFQNVFLKLHRQRHNYKSEFLFVKWIYTISKSELYDFCKKKKITTIEFDEAIHDTETKVTIPDTDFSLDNFKNLSSKEKEAIKLKFYSDQDYDEISQALNTTQSNARKLISRGLGKLRTKLAGGHNES